MSIIDMHLKIWAIVAFVVLPIPFAMCGASSVPFSPKSLRLIPFPKQVKPGQGKLRLSNKMVITVLSPSGLDKPIVDLKKELSSVKSIDCKVQEVAAKNSYALTIALPQSKNLPVKHPLPKDIASRQEGYCIWVTPDGIVLRSGFEKGFYHGVQTLVQLVRANMNGNLLPCMTIVDWPSLGYRGYSDDITRGPSPTLTTLKKEVAISSLLKLNYFTYYLEHQYEFLKHPEIGPKDGSLKQQELRELINFADSYGVEIIGCQQSFGHFEQILKHDEFKDLQENPFVLNPLKEGTYKLLDDLYSEQAPLLKSKFFNICCDETVGLGEGASREVAEKIGIGALYANHIRHIYDILGSKYNKRIMMWGDIILNHPESLKDIPHDTIMLVWNYEPMTTYDGLIMPFKQAGFDFFICPGTSSWQRIVPDFGKAAVNIQNFVRDGTKLGAMGMLNTTWDDDGENLFHLNWHGIAWGAECSWNASATDIKDFNRRIGGVLLGESGDHFGKAIELIEKASKLPGYEGLYNSRFWKIDNGDLPVSREVAWRQANDLLNAIDPAIKELNEARKNAKVNEDILDCFIFAAERVRVMAQRQVSFLDAAKIYQYGYNSIDDKEKAAMLVGSTVDTIRGIRDQHEALRDQYKELWNRENRPYYLDVILARYDGLINQYDNILSKLIASLHQLKMNGALPAPKEVGLAVIERGLRHTKPKLLPEESSAKYSNLTWADNAFGKRVGIVVNSGNVNRTDLPIEINLPSGVGSEGLYRLYDQTDNGCTSIPMQVSVIDGVNRLFFVINGSIPADTTRVFMLYYMPTSPTADISMGKGVSVHKESDDRIWVENENIRLLIGSEGGHIYRWEIKALNNLDITTPGESDWAGFADNYWAHRNLMNRLEIVADGNVMARIRCIDPSGLEKTITVWRNTNWVEIMHNVPCNMFACYDDINIMGTTSEKVGTALFSDGYTERIRPYSNTTSCQIIRDGVRWSAKYNDDILFALITPEIAMKHIVGPGGGMGGLIVEGGPENAHFIIYGGVRPPSVDQTLDDIAATLDLTNQPDVYITASGSKG